MPRQHGEITVPAKQPGRGTLRFALALIAIALSACVATPARAATDEQIKAAVDRGVKYLQNQLASAETGRLSIGVLGLLKAGFPANSPEMQSALARIAGRFDGRTQFSRSADHVYDAGVTLLALANADPRKYRREIEILAAYLIEHQGPEGDWDYPVRAHGDTSISQYAILGLWEATRSGVKIPAGVWDKAARWHVTRQLRDGGFTYHPSINPLAAGQDNATHTMTAAGMASLHIARMHLFGNVVAQVEEEEKEDPAVAEARRKKRKKLGFLKPVMSSEDDEDPEPAGPTGLIRPQAGYKVTVARAGIDEAIVNARTWLDDRFTVAPNTSWSMYYLYALERLAALANVKKFAGHDWYDEGANFLLSKQYPDGHWEDGCGPVPATAFGVMFLIKATAKMLDPPKKRDPRFGGGLLVGGRGLPENLNDVQLDKGSVKVRRLKGGVDELLAELEKSASVDSAQTALVEQVQTENPEALIGQTERLLKLVNHKDPNVRRTAYFALGRTNELRVVPVLIAGLHDSDRSCLVEARNALRFISKRIDAIDLPDEPTPEEIDAAVAQWSVWYRKVRPYRERDDLIETAKP